MVVANVTSSPKWRIRCARSTVQTLHVKHLQHQAMHTLTVAMQAHWHESLVLTTKDGINKTV